MDLHAPWVQRRFQALRFTAEHVDQPAHHAGVAEVDVDALLELHDQIGLARDRAPARLEQAAGAHRVHRERDIFLALEEARNVRRETCAASSKSSTDTLQKR